MFQKFQRTWVYTMSKITARQIAELAQVSPATVSRVMNGRVPVSPQLKDRIMSAAKELGYVIPDKTENDLRLIGILAPKLTYHFYSEIIEGVLDAATSAGYGVVLCPTDSVSLSDFNTPPSFQHISGLVTMCPLQQNSWFSKILPENIPIVQCCEYDEDLPYPFVAIDDYAAAYHATTYLVNLGHRKLSIFNSTCHTLYGKKREQGFRDALADNNIPLREDWVLHLGEIDYNLAQAAAQELFSREDYPDAVFTISDVYAAGIVKSITKLGLHVPDDVSVVGFNDTEIALISEPALTTVHQPRQKMGASACSLLLRLIQTGSCLSQHLWVESDLIVRNSTKSRTNSGQK